MEKTIEYSIEDNFDVYDILDKISNNILIDFAYSSNKDQLSVNQQIITKIQALAQYYPNINAQQAITALDNRIRKYSGQAQAQPA